MAAAHFDDWYNCAPCGYHSLDWSGRFERVNDTELAWLGYTREEMVGKMHFTDLLTPAGIEAFKVEFPLFKQRGWAKDLEFDLMRKDGSILPVLLSATAITDSAGNFVASRATLYDMTERKRVERALSESEQRFRSFFERNNAVMLLINPHSGIVEDANPAAAAFYGYQRSALCAMHIQQINLLSPEEIAAERRKALAEERNYFIFPHRLANGRVRTVEVHSTPVEVSGKPLLFSIVHDITERRRAEEALRESHLELEAKVRQRTAELSAANTVLLAEKARQEALIKQLEEAHNQLLQSEKMSSIGQLAAGVAHEINNPIGFVNSNLGSLQRYVQDLMELLAAYGRVEELLPAGARGEVQQLRRELDVDYLCEDIGKLMSESMDGLRRVKRIVEDLKDFSRVDSTEWQWANLEQGLESTLNVVWNEIKYKAEVVKEYGSIPEIECIPSQLNQVFMNLLVNAAQAIENNGRITLRTGLEPAEVWVEVEDSGKGIPPENLSRIFEPFFTTKPVGKGTGLGLSLSYGIVQKHGGRIAVHSEVGRGTRFRVYLPIQRPADSGSLAG